MESRLKLLRSNEGGWGIVTRSWSLYKKKSESKEQKERVGRREGATAQVEA